MEKIYLEIREAEGGLDSKLLVEEMYKIYEKSCIKNSYKLRTLN